MSVEIGDPDNYQCEHGRYVLAGQDCPQCHAREMAALAQQHHDALVAALGMLRQELGRLDALPDDLSAPLQVRARREQQQGRVVLYARTALHHLDCWEEAQA